MEVKELLAQYTDGLRDFKRVVLSYRAELSGEILRDADFTGANLAGVKLSQANLSNTNLTGANLEQADLKEANLSGAYLRGANLSGVNFYGADLSGADLTNANLTNATLSKAELTGADLNRVNFSYANLSGAKLRLANNLGGAKFFRAVYDTKTKFPRDFNPSLPLWQFDPTVKLEQRLKFLMGFNTLILTLLIFGSVAFSLFQLWKTNQENLSQLEATTKKLSEKKLDEEVFRKFQQEEFKKLDERLSRIEKIVKEQELEKVKENLEEKGSQRDVERLQRRVDNLESISTTP